MPYSRFLIALATTSLIPFFALAEDNDENPKIENLIITGTLFETPLDQAGRSVSIITSDQIELRQQRFLFEALTTVPGLQITQTGSFGGVTSVSVRGLDSDQTLVVLDGVVLNNPGSFGTTFNFANFDTADIEQIEVIRGAQSTLYGSDAIGGVINIVSSAGKGDLAGSGFIEGGSFGTFRGGVNLRGGTERFSGRLSLNGVRTSGFSSALLASEFDDTGSLVQIIGPDGLPLPATEDDGFESFAVSAKGAYKVTDELRTEVVLRYQDSENDFDGFAGAPVDQVAVGETEELVVGGFVYYDMFDGRLSHRASVTFTSNNSINFVEESDGDSTESVLDFDSQGTRLSYEYRGQAQIIDQVALIFGAEYEVQEAVTEVGFGGDQEIETASGYGLLQVAPIERVSLTAGIRHDTSSEFGSETVFNAAGSIRIPIIETTLRGSYSEGFRAPSAGELGFNPDLFAEFSTGWDIGLERSFFEDRVTASITYFDQEVDDLIAFDLALFTFANVQEFDTSGIELAIGAQILPTLRLDIAYTHLDAFNVSTTLAGTNQPDDRFNAEISWQPIEKLNLSAGVLFNGPEPDAGIFLDAFTLLSLRAEYALTDRIDLTLRINNATDADFIDNAGFGTPPISAFGGIRARF
ncbi:MAG: TonB-dependent receptor [Pseudomonadota bacterium]